MDVYEATKIVMSRIQTLDPDHASKIMGYILIQDQGEKEIIRLAFGPESSLISLINQAKSCLRLSSTIQIPRPVSGSGGFDDEMDPVHRRSCSVNDASDGWKPCVYFAKGFCKNGAFCKFSHGFGEMGGFEPGKSFDEVLRLQHKFGLMGSGFNSYPFCHGKFVNENLRNEFSQMGMGEYGSSTSRQIYLTFPADSAFKEEDVAGYFSMFGPVEDVRIPYQQKRMFGFVTFTYPETVKLILAKGNPHFVCDSRVLVKPYKEKGKMRLLHSDSGDCSACLSPDSGEHFDLPFGSRTLCNTQEMMLRRTLEQDADLQYAIELQERRLMALQLMDFKNQNQNFLPSSPPGVPIFSPRQSQFLMNQNVNRAVSGVSEFGGHREFAKFLGNATVTTDLTDSSDKNIGSGNEKFLNGDGPVLPERISFEHILPDNLFASPTKKSSAAEQHSTFSQAFSSDNGNMFVTNSSSYNKTSLLPDSSPLSMASLKPCYSQMPRNSIEVMESGTGSISGSNATMSELEKLQKEHDEKLARIQELKGKKEAMMVEREKKKGRNPDKMKEFEELSEKYNSHRNIYKSLQAEKRSFEKD